MNAALLSSIRKGRADSSDDDDAPPVKAAPAAPKPSAMQAPPKLQAPAKPAGSGPFDDVADATLREQLCGFVDQIKSGKPAKVINMVMKSALPPNCSYRSRVFTLAGVADPDGGAAPAAPAPAAPPAAAAASKKSKTEAPKASAVTTVAIVPSAVMSPQNSPPGSPRESAPFGDDKAKKKKKKKKEAVAERMTTISANFNVEQAGADVDPRGNGVGSGISPSWLIALVMASGCLCAADATIIFPSLWEYVHKLLGGSNLYYGLVAGSFNCAQAVIAPVLGAWSDARNIKEVLLFSTLLSVAGNALYLSATAQAQDEVPTDGQFSHALSMLFVARLIAGAGAGFSLIAYGHLTKLSTTLYLRHQRLERYAWLLRVGQIVAPAIGAIGAHFPASGDKLTVDAYSVPPLVMTVAFSIFFVVVLVHFCMTLNDTIIQRSDAFDPEALEAQVMGQSGEGAVGGARVQEQGPLSLESFLYIAVYFTHIFAYWSFMAAVVPFMETEYSYSTSSIYLYFLFVGVGFVVAYGIYRLLSYKFSEARLVPLSLIVSAGGLMSLYHSDSTPIAIWQIILASSLLVIGFCIASLTLPRIYADMVGARMNSVGLRSAWFFGVSSLAMVIGPLVGAFASIGIVAFTAFIALMLSLVFVVLRPARSSAVGATSAQQMALQQSLLESNEYQV